MLQNMTCHYSVAILEFVGAQGKYSQGTPPTREHLHHVQNDNLTFFLISNIHMSRILQYK